MTALNELRRHMGLDWKKMGREKLTAHLEQSLERIGEEQQKLAAKVGAPSVDEMERLLMTGQLKGKDAASYASTHQDVLADPIGAAGPGRIEVPRPGRYRGRV